MERSYELSRAAQDGDVATVVRLLDAGVAVDTLGEDARTALDLAAQCNQADVVRVLLAAGADTAAHAGPYGDLTPLTCAAMFGSTEAVGALLDAGVSMAAQDRIPYTPLVVAVGDNHLETVALLVEREADGARMGSRLRARRGGVPPARPGGRGHGHGPARGAVMRALPPPPSQKP
ncbi:ankyrin repeat domain-containing protein [Streptomyces sp. AC512_CC834]|uniref:ankyrin repeat domain-containing protein n=1 Tax=Streptomyces sp. AC512_CC834 TaxID=2823691 RepID=UPI001C25B232|nr:ankyrin repeat domain-containing protein [Streptomyces sp. AC512_CC834]